MTHELVTLPPLPDPPVRKANAGKVVTTATLSNYTCHWPIGDPTEAEFHYCGAAPARGRRYCAAHTEKAYQPVQRRRVS